MFTFVHALFLLFALFILLYHFVYVREVRKTETQVGIALAGMAKKLLALNTLLVLSFTTIIAIFVFLSFIF